jgi:hypothetical protein
MAVRILVKEHTVSGASSTDQRAQFMERHQSIEYLGSPFVSGVKTFLFSTKLTVFFSRLKPTDNWQSQPS